MDNNGRYRFQFHKGTIKTGCMPEDVYDDAISIP